MSKNRNLIILSGLVFLFFLPVLLSPYIWGFRDFHRYIYPLKFFARESILSGIIPLWNPYLAGGMPYLANLQSCIFYPPSILIYILPFNLGLKIYVLFHFALAAVSMYQLCRNFGLSETSSFVASIVWAFSGWMVSSIDIVIILTSSAWLPLILLFALKSKDSFRYSILTGIALSFQFLGGEPSIFYFSILLLVLFSFYFKLKTRRTFLSILIGIGLSLFQLLPFLEMVSYSERLYTQKNTTLWAFMPPELFRFILPSATGSMVRPPSPHLYLGQMWLKSPYFGIIPFILVVVAILYPKKEKAVLFFCLLSLFSILLAFGDRTPLYKLSQLLPLFSLVRYPVKWLYLATFSMSFLAGFSVDYIVKREKVPISLIIFAAGLIFFLIAFCFSTNYSIFNPFLIKGEMAKWVKYLCLDSSFVLMVLGAFLITTILFRRSLLKEKWYKILLFGLILTDLFWFSEELNPVVKESLYHKELVVVKLFKSNKNKYFRYCLSPKTNEDFQVIKGAAFEEALEKANRFIAPNAGMLFGLFDAGAYDSIYLADYFGFRRLTGITAFQKALPVISMTNIKYIISKWPIKEEGIRLIYSEDELFVYENPSFLDRCFFVGNFKVIKDRKEVLNYIFSESFDPSKEVILEEEPEKFKIQNSKFKIQNSKFKIIKYEPNKVSIDVDAPTDGFLFLSDTYYPGWTATIDSKKTKIYRANFCFRAIKLSKGQHLIEMGFLPKSFVVGLAGSFVSLIFITFSCNYSLQCKKRGYGD